MMCVECANACCCSSRNKNDGKDTVERTCKSFVYFLEQMNSGELKLAEYKSKFESKIENDKGKGLFE